MIEDTPSRTALRVALRRAAHQVLDEPLVLVDPTAVAITGLDAERIRAQPWHNTRIGRGLRAFLAVRSRWCEDRLADAVGRGVAQYVLLGAGLDTFAYRNPFAGLRVFEVDHPATQRMKRERAAAAGLAPRGEVVHVPVDFTRQDLADELAAAGFSTARPAFFAWLGVVMYLEPAAIERTLRFVASVAAPVEVVFDYPLDPRLLPFTERLVVKAIARKVAADGEPFRSWFDPADLHARLAGIGFDRVEDLGPPELNARFFAGRRDGLRLAGTSAHLLSASRTE